MALEVGNIGITVLGPSTDFFWCGGGESSSRGCITREQFPECHMDFVSSSRKNIFLVFLSDFYHSRGYGSRRGLVGLLLEFGTVCKGFKSFFLCVW